MNPIDILIIAIVLVIIILAIRSIRKNAKKGGCAGCSSCGSGDEQRNDNSKSDFSPLNQNNDTTHNKKK